MSILKHKWLNDWSLFYVFATINSAAIVLYLPTQDLSTPRGISEMIQWSVRLCVPLLFLAFVSSSIVRYVPRILRQWLTRNRRYFGLGFAFGMAWQLVFIFWLLFAHPDYYAESVYLGFKDFLIYRLGPYLFLIAMTITSFYSVRRKMNAKVWYAIHWVGIYYLWYDVQLTYWEEITIYKDYEIIDYIYVTLGGLAYLTRVLDWALVKYKKLQKVISK